MSEYQYLEFRRLDHPLSDEEMGAVGALSTRAEFDRWTWTNTYSFGNFKHDPRKVLERFYDAFLYVSNWGTYRLMFRFPKTLFDLQAVKPYGCSSVDAWTTRDYCCLELSFNEDGPDEWVEGEGKLGGLVALRDELLAGDLRPIYIAWLAARFDPDLDDVTEPPVPPGLGSLTRAQRELADFLRVDAAALAVAADGSESLSPDRGEDFEGWLRGLPAAERTDWLVKLASDEGPTTRRELVAAYRRGKPSGPPAAAGRRTLEVMRDRFAAAENELRRRAEEKRRQAAEAEVERRMKRIADQGEAAVWTEVDDKLASKRHSVYKEVVQSLTDLVLFARRAGRESGAVARIDRLRQAHATKKAFIQQLNQAQRSLGTGSSSTKVKR